MKGLPCRCLLQHPIFCWKTIRLHSSKHGVLQYCLEANYHQQLTHEANRPLIWYENYKQHFPVLNIDIQIPQWNSSLAYYKQYNQAMFRSLQNFTALHSHKAVWCRYYCDMDCKTTINPRRCIISKQQSWPKFSLVTCNQKQALGRLPKLRYLLREHTFTGELTYEPSNYKRAVLSADFLESSFDHSSIRWNSRNRVTWLGKWANELT